MQSGVKQQKPRATNERALGVSDSLAHFGRQGHESRKIPLLHVISHMGTLVSVGSSLDTNPEGELEAPDTTFAKYVVQQLQTLLRTSSLWTILGVLKSRRARMRSESSGRPGSARLSFPATTSTDFTARIPQS